MRSNATADTVIEFRGVSFQTSEGKEILKNISFRLLTGETLVLLGRSGAGKTTALKMVNYLFLPTSGEVFVENKSTRDWDPIHLRRRVGYVIQETGLFPHFTVEQNVALVPRLEGWDEKRVKSRVRELLLLVGLDPAGFMRRYPGELSGGQRQRVGVARALAADPPILLMDEPFGSLDPITRAELQKEFAALAKKLGKTILFVTHDVREAFLLATRIGLMKEGLLVNIAPPDEFLRLEDPEARAFTEPLRSREFSGKT